MANKPAVISFDDTEEDDFDRPQQVSSISTSSHPSPAAAGTLPSRVTVPAPLATTNSEFNTSSGSININAPPSPTDNRPRSASFASKMRPQSMFVKSANSIVDEVKKETKEKRDRDKHESGTLSKLKASIFNKGKKQEPPKKIAIGTPSNFHYVAGQGGIPASLALAVPNPSEERGEPQSLHPSSQTHSSSIKSSKSHESVSSVGTSHTNSSDTNELTGDMIQSDPKAFTRLTKKKIEDLIEGAYFLQHTKSANTQKFVSCSEDMSCLNFWANIYDKDAGVPPQEAYKFSEILGIKLGYSTPIFRDTGIEGRQVLAFSLVLQNKTTLDFEAFSPADKDFWVESFNGLISLVKAQSIPAPMNRPHHSNSGHVSAL